MQLKKELTEFLIWYVEENGMQINKHHIKDRISEYEDEFPEKFICPDNEEFCKCKTDENCVNDINGYGDSIKFCMKCNKNRENKMLT